MSTKAWLDGARIDLALLADLFETGDIRIEHTDAQYALVSSRLDGLTGDGAKLRDTAQILLDEVNGTATLQHASFSPVRLSGGFEDTDGRKHVVVAVGTAVGRAIVPPVGIRINGQLQPSTAPGDAVMAAATTHPDVAQVLRIMSWRPFGWIEIYKVFEIIRDNVRTPLDKTGWITKAELSRLTENCNRPELGGPEARHARLKGRPGSAPMEIGEAREQIRILADRWIRSL